MSYHGLDLDLSFSASASGSGASASYKGPSASGSGGGGIDWGTVCSGHGSLSSKSYVSELDYAFKCSDGFGCRRKPGSADVCGYSSGSAPPPPPPSTSAPFTFYAASFDQPKASAASLLAAAAPKPATQSTFSPWLGFMAKPATQSTFSPWLGFMAKPSQEAAPPVQDPVAEEDKTMRYVAWGVGLLILVGAGVYITKRKS